MTNLRHLVIIKPNWCRRHYGSRQFVTMTLNFAKLHRYRLIKQIAVIQPLISHISKDFLEMMRVLKADVVWQWTQKLTSYIRQLICDFLVVLGLIQSYYLP